jgi:SET domain-containing protein
MTFAALIVCCSWAVVDLHGARSVGVDIQPIHGKGLGAIATRPLKLGDRLGRYEGERLTEREWNLRFNGKGRARQSDNEWLEERRRRGIRCSGDYILAFGDAEYIDAEDPECSNWCRYINHDSNPNLGLFKETDDAGNMHPTFIVIRTRVAPGDELCFDYGPGYWIDDEEPVESADLMWGDEDALAP